MNFKSIFKASNYIYLFNLLKPYDSSVKRKPTKTFKYSLYNLGNVLELKNIKKIIVVASGPSSNQIKFEKDALYFCCNNSIQLVNKFNFIYFVHDPFYLNKYLKSFDGTTPSWNSTIFFIDNNMSLINEKSFNQLHKYLNKYHRQKREILITNFESDYSNTDLFNEIKKYLLDKFSIEFKSINSGFNMLQIASVISDILDVELDIYGLDLGVGGNMYFNKKHDLGKSIVANANKNEIAIFLDKLYIYKSDVKNFSFFKTKL